MNDWGIPKEVEEIVLVRDRTCAYCNIEMLERKPKSGSLKTVATWEHVINDLSDVSVANIVRCCWSCNSSKGDRDIRDWLNGRYCADKSITAATVSPTVKAVLERLA